MPPIEPRVSASERVRERERWRRTSGELGAGSEGTNAVHAVLGGLHARSSDELHRRSDLLDAIDRSHADLDCKQERDRLIERARYRAMV